MKKIIQPLFLFISVLISLSSCSNYQYSEDDEVMGFGPVSDIYLDKQKRFKSDEKYNIHDNQ